MHAVSLRLPDELGQRLQVLAEQTGRSKTYYMLEAIQEHIENLEDMYLAEAAVLRIRRGEETVYSADEMERLLAVDN